MVFTDDSDEQSANKQVSAVYTLIHASGIFASLQQIVKREDMQECLLGRRRQLEDTHTQRYLHARDLQTGLRLYLSICSLIELPKEEGVSVPYL